MKFLLIIISIFIHPIVYSQNFQSEFQIYFNENDTINQLKVLEAWEKSKPDDPELFTSYFNYYVQKAESDIITLTTEQLEGESFVLKDSLNATVGFLGSQTWFKTEEIEKGFAKIERGIKLYPNRLDMRFGKIYVLGLLKDWENFTLEIIKTVRYSSQNNNEWLWINNEQLDEAKGFMLASIQSYQLQLFDTGDDALLKNMRDISEEILRYYPDHIESLSNISITYLLTGAYDKGIETLLKAEKLNPKDFIVLSNIARGYELKGDKENAVLYYEKTIEYGDEEAKQFATQRLEELKK
ncbi:MAG: tetratricopeptide repeat protein [Weeksellaceae bacterium]